MTRQEHLDNLIKEVAKLDELHSNRVMHRKMFFWCICFIVICCAYILPISHSMKHYQELYEGYTNNISNGLYGTVPIDIMSYEDLYEIWNYEEIGNDINVLISGGSFYKHGALKIIPAGYGSTIIYNDKTQFVFDKAISYVQVHGDDMYYRDDASANIMRFNLKTHEDTLMLDVVSGEFSLSGNDLFYIDLADHSILKRHGFDDGITENISDISVSKFALLGNYLMILDVQGNLWRTDRGGDNKLAIAESVSTFCIGDYLFYQQGDSIYRLSYDWKDTEKIADKSADTDYFKLVGSYGDGAYHQTDDKMLWSSDSVKNKELNTTTSNEIESVLDVPEGRILGYIWPIPFDERVSDYTCDRTEMEGYPEWK